jgi:parallel beta-helix repeat protein
MKRTTYATLISVVFALLAAPPAAAQPRLPISGEITSTLDLFQNAELVGDVTCNVANGPCLRISAPHVKLRLNGFTITGPADPPTDCVATTNFLPEDGIAVVNQEHVAILGPGVVQRFRRHGLLLIDSRMVKVQGLVSHHNCFSGLQMIRTTESEIVENVSVRNAIASEGFPCGGNCITNSHNNRIRRNEFGGNGSVAAGNNDFGVGLTGTSSGNVIEENSIMGNTNGMLIQALAGGNLIRRNIIIGNPPVQVSAAFGATVGFDIRNLSPAGANTFEENLCLSYSGAAPAPCPGIPKFSGHHNTSQASGQAPNSIQ